MWDIWSDDGHSDKEWVYQNAKKIIKNTLNTLLDKNILHRSSKNKTAYIYEINYNNPAKQDIIIYEVGKMREDNIIKRIKYIKAEEYLFYAASFKVLLLYLRINLVMYIYWFFYLQMKTKMFYVLFNYQDIKYKK